MQVLCKSSHTQSDIRCKVCGQGFLVYWSRGTRAERDAMRLRVAQELAAQHAHGDSAAVHPQIGFALPQRAESSAPSLLGNTEILAA